MERLGNDSLYLGDYVRGKREGQGEFYCKEMTYKGRWKNDLFHGFGHWYLNPNQNELEVNLIKSRYLGYFKKGKR